MDIIIHRGTHQIGGHASAEQLRAVCDAVQPRQGVLPIHTEAPEVFDALMAPWPVRHLSDGEVCSLG